MIFFGGVLGLVALAVWIFCIVDAITTPADQVRVLPKLAWVGVVIFLLDLGALAWLVAGRPWARAMSPGGRPADGTSRHPVFGSAAGSSGRRSPRRPLSPDDDDEWLAGLPKRNDPPAE